ncbi:MAG: hypothetical protein WCL51_16795 [Bacteroidota bacterium]
MLENEINNNSFRPIHKTRLSKKEKLVYSLIKKIFIVIACFLFVYSFFYFEIGNPYYEFLLVTKGITTKGYITYVEEHEDVAEQNGNSRDVYNVYYEYTFITKDGKTIKSSESDVSPVSGYLHEANKNPIPITVKYIANHPEINFDNDKVQYCNTIVEYLWRRLIIYFIILLIGFTYIYKAMKNYLSESKKIDANIE